MDVILFNDLYKACEVIEARETLTRLKIMDYPSNMKDDDRSKLHSSIYKKAFPKNKSKVYSFDDIEKALGL